MNVMHLSPASLWKADNSPGSLFSRNADNASSERKDSCKDILRGSLTDMATFCASATLSRRISAMLLTVGIKSVRIAVSTSAAYGGSVMKAILNIMISGGTSRLNRFAMYEIQEDLQFERLDDR